MARIAGIPGLICDTDFKGNIKRITIDVKKQPETAIYILHKYNISENGKICVPNKKTAEAINEVRSTKKVILKMPNDFY
ncbi:MAG: hypothetical protein WCK78_09085 [Paludibacter sp.]